ncbi:GmrSD restriction endonuclease domain-containing protein [Gaetbulibacter sp. PBL-D1]|uniref:GmrSD restriction endonuclease domain-containing protein n=1 Tax=Gaetbulibacter sp. PBL-D1 TaxID=3422594 RepID=UPI003D2F4B57
MAKYSVHQQPVETLLSWIKSGEIAIPEIQRPFVWKNSKVRDLIDSLYQGYPVGYIITWRNPDVKLKNGELSAGKKVLIDGQQRITALTAAVVGQRVLNKNYKEINIRIAFNPLTEKFEVLNKAFEKSPEWINNINPIINDEISVFEAIDDYMTLNPEADKRNVIKVIEKLKGIKTKQVGIIELDHSLDIDTVTDIFIRINQKGVVLSNADFVMSKIASDEVHEGNKMRKQVDYFCRLLVDKDFNKHILDNDTNFANTEYYKAIKWMATGSDDLFVPDYIDVLRVAYTYKFSRGKFSDLVALLSGRNFEARTYENEIAEQSYKMLSEGLMDVVNQTSYQRFIMLIKSAGLINQKLISSKNSLNFSYALYLKLRHQGMPESEIQHYVKRWLVLSLLIGRYSGSAESMIDEDIKQINEKGIEVYLKQMEQNHLGQGFWEFALVNQLESSSINNNAYNVYLAAQCYNNAPAFLSKSMKISSLIEQRGDIHHIFPKKYLSKNSYLPKQYNQVANFVYTEQATNIKVGMMTPHDYLAKVMEQILNKVYDISTLDSRKDLEENLWHNDIPNTIYTSTHIDYNDFLIERRKLMAAKIKAFYEQL